MISLSADTATYDNQIFITFKQQPLQLTAICHRVTTLIVKSLSLFFSLIQAHKENQLHL